MSPEESTRTAGTAPAHEPNGAAPPKGPQPSVPLSPEVASAVADGAPAAGRLRTIVARGTNGRRLRAPAPARPERAEVERTVGQLGDAWKPLLAGRAAPRRVWREQVLTRAAEVQATALWLDSRTDGPSTSAAGWVADATTDATVLARLRTARSAAEGRSGSVGGRRARMERAFAEVDGAEAALVRRGPDWYLRGQIPALRAHVQAHLPPSHPERVYVEGLAETPPFPPFTDVQRVALSSAVLSASSAARREHIRLRSFKMTISTTALLLLVLAVTLAVVSWNAPSAMPLCFAPAGTDAVVCPTGSAPIDGTSAAGIAAVIGETAAPGDAALVMLLGLCAAAVTGAAALRRVRGTSTPFSVPVALLALKLPLGALTAFFGLLLIHGQIVPGLSALDSSAQILAWALLFGAAQQLVTGLVDKKAQSVLESVGSSPMTSDKE